MRAFLIGLPASMIAIVLAAMALPTGEIVTLHTVDADGRDFKSQLWIVEIEGTNYLRSGNVESSWLERLGTHPRVEIERDDERTAFRATVVDDASLRQVLNDALAAKYGVADQLVGRTVDLSASMPVRLDPIEGPGVHDH